MKFYVEIAAALFAGGAAVLWFASAMVKIPKNFPITVVSTHTMAETIIGAEVVSAGSSPELDDLGMAVIKQSFISAGAAGSAGVAAVCQAAAIFLQN